MPAITPTNFRVNSVTRVNEAEISDVIFILLSQLKAVSFYTPMQNAVILKPRQGNPYDSASQVCITYDYVFTSPLNSELQVKDINPQVTRVYQIAITMPRSTVNEQLISVIGDELVNMLTDSSLHAGTSPNEQRAYFSTPVKKLNADGTVGSITSYEYQIVTDLNEVVNKNKFYEGQSPQAPQNYVTYLFDYVTHLTIIHP